MNLCRCLCHMNDNACLFANGFLLSSGCKADVESLIFSVLPVIQVSLLYRPTALRKKLSSFALYVHLKSNLYLSHLIQKKQPVMMRYRQEHCGMVLMLLLIRYLFLSTRLLILALCRLLGSWPKSAPSSIKGLL